MALIVPGAAQMVLEDIGKSDQPAHHDPRLFVIMPGIISRRPDMVDDQPAQRAGTDHQFPPKLTAFPPAVIAGGVAEPEEDGKRQADQS